MREWIKKSLGINRSIALAITPTIAKTSLTPNQVTTLSMLFGFAAAICMAQGKRIQMLEGALLLQISFILDNCDGALARLKSLQSEVGMWFDYIADLFVDFAMWIGLGFGTVAQKVITPHLAILLVVFACAGSVVNFVRVVSQRRAKKGSDAYMSTLSLIVTQLGDDADPSLFVWFLAFLGYPGYLLFFGTLYINFIWIFSVGRSLLRQEEA